jgi:hypothetical protein
MASSETFYTKNVINELIFLLVTHMTHFDIQFCHYGALKFCFGSGQVMDRSDCRCLVRFLGHNIVETR